MNYSEQIQEAKTEIKKAIAAGCTQNPNYDLNNAYELLSEIQYEMAVVAEGNAPEPGCPKTSSGAHAMSSDGTCVHCGFYDAEWDANVTHTLSSDGICTHCGWDNNTDVADVLSIDQRIQVWINRLNEIAPKHSWGDYSFELVQNPSGNGKYHRVVMSIGGTSSSVHAFVDAEGHVFKSEGWKKPAKGVRYDLANDESFAAILQDATWSGGYLYRGAQSYQLPA